MRAKCLLLATALLTLPVTAFAQAAQSQPGAPASSTGAASPPSNTGSQQPTPAPGAIVPATTADLVPNANVYDPSGGQVGTIEAVTGTGATVFTGTARAQIPVASFSKNSQGLLIGMTKAQLEAAVAQASAKK